MKFLTLIFALISTFCFSQQNYFVITIDKFDNFYPKENERFFWIINACDEKPKISPLYFFNVDEEMRILCNKNNHLGIFNRLENTLPGKKLDEVLHKIYVSKKLVLSIKNKNTVDKRQIKYKIYVTKIKAQKLFSCNIDNEDGEKIGYQGSVFFLNENFTVDNYILKSDYTQLSPVYLLNLNYIKTNPYEQIRFK